MGRFPGLADAGNRSIRSPRTQRSIRKLFLPALALVLLGSFLLLGRNRHASLPFFGKWGKPRGRNWRMPLKPSDNYRYSATVVTGVLQDKLDEGDWVNEVENVERKAVYVVDNTTAPLHLERNHGRESMVYLQYILEHYDNLTDVTFFMHAHPVAWHNNVLLRHHALPTLNLLRRSYVQKQGYVNTRCDLHPGCPRWIRFDPSEREDKSQPTRVINIYNSETLLKLYPDTKEMPQYLAAPCCAQFAVSRETIQAVPLETYKRLHAWIRDDPLDGFTGRFMEYTWQYLFLGKEELCPAMTTCYCELYGICDLDADLLMKWQSNQVRANELEDRMTELGFLYSTRANQSVDDDDEYKRLRPTANKLWAQSNTYGEEVYVRFSIPPLEGEDEQ